MTNGCSARYLRARVAFTIDDGVSHDQTELVFFGGQWGHATGPFYGLFDFVGPYGDNHDGQFWIRPDLVLLADPVIRAFTGGVDRHSIFQAQPWPARIGLVRAQ